MILYIAGPMTGRPQHNYPAFFDAAELLEQAGHDVLNPALIDEDCALDEGERTWAWYMRRALVLLTQADGVALLPDWQNSRGASVEKYLADHLEMPTRDLQDWLP